MCFGELDLNHLRLVSIFISGALVSLVVAACNRIAPGSGLAGPSDSAHVVEQGLALYKEGEFEKALELWRPLADQGYARAQSDLGMAYVFGKGVGQDYAQAVTWYRKAADQGNAEAQYNLGVMYANGQGLTKDDAQAVTLYSEAADQGNTQAQFCLGYMYVYGRAVAKDEVRGVAWFIKAADQGNADAQRALGVMYANGQGVAKDNAKAIAWYRKAASQGDANAQHDLDMMHDNGEGFFAVLVHGGNKYELSDEPVSTCVQLKGEDQWPWKFALITGRWMGRVKSCWYKAHVERANMGPGPKGDVIIPAHDVIVICLPYVHQKGAPEGNGPACQNIDPVYFTAVDSLPHAAF